MRNSSPIALIVALGPLSWGACVAQENLHSFSLGGKLNSIAFEANAKFLIAGGGDFEPVEGEEPAAPEEGEEESGPVSYLGVWDMKTGQMVAQPTGHEGEVCGVAYAANGKRAASAGADGKVILWYTTTWKPAAPPLKGHKGKVLCLAFNPASNQVAAGDEQGNVFIWDVNSKRKTYAVPQSDAGGAVRCLAYPANRNVLAIGGDDNLIRIWDITRRKKVAILEGHSAKVIDLCFSLNGKLLLAADASGRVLLWDLGKGEVKREMSSGAGESTRATYSSDGRLILTSGEGNTLKLWETGTGKLLRDDIEINSPPTGLRFLPNKKSLLVGLTDEAIVMKNPSRTSQEEEAVRQRNRLVVWGACDPGAIKGNWGIQMYQQLEEPYDWVLAWQSDPGVNVPIRASIRGNVDFKGSGDRDRDRKRTAAEERDDRATAILRKLEKIKKRRGNIYGDFLIEGGPGSFTFKNTGSSCSTNWLLPMVKGNFGSSWKRSKSTPC